jgi:hypothetical protein
MTTEIQELWHMTPCSVVHKFLKVDTYIPGHTTPCVRILAFTRSTSPFNNNKKCNLKVILYFSIILCVEGFT